MSTKSDFIVDGRWYPCRRFGSACCDDIAKYNGEGDGEYANNMNSSSWLLEEVCVFRGRAWCCYRRSKPFGGCAAPRGHVDKHVGQVMPTLLCDCEKKRGLYMPSRFKGAYWRERARVCKGITRNEGRASMGRRCRQNSFYRATQLMQ